MAVRQPVVAGQFYPAGKEELQSELDSIYRKVKSKINTQNAAKGIIGGIVPHAGYVFSASHAMHYFKNLVESGEKPETFIILNPNHTGLGAPVAMDTHDTWHTPLGDAPVDMELGKNMGLSASKEAHMREHAAEVMVPLLQYFVNHPFSILPVSIGNQSYSTAHNLAQTINESARKLKRNISVIASTDFSHFVPHETGKKMDDLALNKIKAMDAPGVEKVINTHHISVCGFGPIMTLMEYAGLVSKKPAVHILSRGSSGDVIPSSEVVDYVAAMITKQ